VFVKGIAKKKDRSCLFPNLLTTVHPDAMRRNIGSFALGNAMHFKRSSNISQIPNICYCITV
jgi:hypothetical protein